MTNGISVQVSALLKECRHISLPRQDNSVLGFVQFSCVVY